MNVEVATRIANSRPPAARRSASIASIVSVALVSVVTLLLALAGAAAYQSYRTREWAELQRHHAALADQLATSLASPLWNFDRATLAKIGESAFANPILSGLSVRASDDDSIVLARARDPRWRSVSVAKLAQRAQDLRETRAITFEGEVIGTVDVFASPRFVQSSLQAGLVTLIVSIAALDLLLVLGLYVLLYRIVLRPLQRMKTYAQAVSSGTASAPALDGATLRGEMSSLQDSLVRMVEQQRDAYQQLSQLHRRLESAKDEERRTLSHELHDELGQTLTALKLRMHMVVREAQLPTREDVDGLVALVDGLIGRIRKMSVDLRPPLLDELGLESALQALIGAQAGLSGTQLVLDASGLSPRFAPEVEMACFRIVQEGITNIQRHASARRAEVRVQHESGRLRIVITDDGAGVSAERVAARARAGHLGIVGMRERARALGGDFALSSPAAGGTRIEVSLPAQLGSAS
jgi:signal transduction histidine kinase